MSAIQEVKPRRPKEDEELGIDPGEIAHSALYAQREKMVNEFGLKQDGHDDYIIPDTGWTERYFSTYDRANYLAYLKHYKPWVKPSKYGTAEGVVLDRRKLPIMPIAKLQGLLDDITHVKEDYPILDDDIHSNLEMELQDKAWDEYYRKEFKEMVKDAVEPYFEGKVTRASESMWDIVEELFDGPDGDKLADDLFYDYLQNSNGDDWETQGDGSMSLRMDRIKSEAQRKGLVEEWYRKIMELKWPEDPRQLKFKFAEEIVRRLLDGCTTLLEASGAAHVMAASLLEDAGPHKYSCVMINLPKEIGDNIIAWGRQQIPDEQLFVDEDGGCGREEEPHVTVKYGLHDAMPSDELKKIFTSTAPFSIVLEPITLFRNDGYDVVKMDVTSPQLHEFNRQVSTTCECTDTYPEYKPHVTIAYVKPGTCDRLEGVSPFDSAVKMGTTTLRKDGVFDARQVVFSSRTGIKKDYGLGPEEPEKEQVEESDYIGTTNMGTQGTPVKDAYKAIHKDAGMVSGANSQNWRYIERRNVVLWNTPPTEEDKHSVDEFLAKRGITGYRHRSMYNENEEPGVDIDPGEIARLGGATGEEVTLRHLRRAAGRELIRAIHISRKGEGKYPAGELRIAFDRGPVRYVGFCSLGVLAQALRQWRNLQGVTLYVDNKPAGKISYQNPVLAELARW